MKEGLTARLDVLRPAIKARWTAMPGTEEPAAAPAATGFITPDTFASLLANAGVSELARPTTWRQTDRYTDPKSVPLFLEIEKLTSAPASSIASKKSGKSGQNESKAVQVGSPFQNVKIIHSPSENVTLGTGSEVHPPWRKESLSLSFEGAGGSHAQCRREHLQPRPVPRDTDDHCGEQRPVRPACAATGRPRTAPGR